VPRWGRRGILSFPCHSVWENDGSFSTWVPNILDSDGDTGADDLVHGERMDDFGTVVGKLRGFLRGDNGDESGGTDFAGVGGEDTINFFPDLELICIEPNGTEGSAEVGVSTADLGEEGTRDNTKVSYERVRVSVLLGATELLELRCSVPVMTGTLGPHSFNLFASCPVR